MIYILNYNRLGAHAGDEIELDEVEGERLARLGFVTSAQHEDTLEAEIEPQPEEDESLEDEPTDGGEDKED